MKTEDYLVPTENEEILERFAPVTFDPIDSEVRAAHYREKRTARIAMIGLSGACVVLACGLTSLISRPPQRIFYRIDSVGAVGRANGRQDVYVGTPAQARYFLKQWATFRYDRQRDSIVENFQKNYLFLSKPVYQKLHADDLKNDVIANVLTGKQSENTVQVTNPQIFSFEKKNISGTDYWAGAAVIDMIKTVAHGEEGRPRTESWRVSVEFLINEAQVQKQTETNPNYEVENPIGLTITKVPVENRLPDSK